MTDGLVMYRYKCRIYICNYTVSLDVIRIDRSYSMVLVLHVVIIIVHVILIKNIVIIQGGVATKQFWFCIFDVINNDAKI